MASTLTSPSASSQYPMPFNQPIFTDEELSEIFQIDFAEIFGSPEKPSKFGPSPKKPLKTVSKGSREKKITPCDVSVQKKCDAVTPVVVDVVKNCKTTKLTVLMLVLGCHLFIKSPFRLKIALPKKTGLLSNKFSPE